MQDHPLIPTDAAPRGAAARITYGTLDAWRGVAALWVVLTHAAIMPGLLQANPQMQARPLYAFAILGSLGVQLFFVISGFCIANAAAGALDKPRGAWLFCKARVRRIYPPYFVASLLAIALALFAAWLVSRGYLKSSSMAENNPLARPAAFYLSSLTLTQVPLGHAPLVDVFWTLCYEVAFYAVALVALAVTRLCRGRATHLLTALHVLTLVTLLGLIRDPAGNPFPFNLWPQFGLGVLVFDILSSRGSRRAVGLAVAAGALSLVVAALYDLDRRLGGVGTRGQFITCTLFAAALVVLHRHDVKLAGARAVRALAFVGLFSYSLYLTHLIVLGVALQLVRRFGAINPDTFAYVFWLEVALTLPCALAFFWLFERPFMSVKRDQLKVAPPAAGSESTAAAAFATTHETTADERLEREPAAVGAVTL